jgi:hypothetical protein
MAPALWSSVFYSMTSRGGALEINNEPAEAQMSSEPWSRVRWNRNEPTRFEERVSVDADDQLVLDLSSSSSSMPVATPCDLVHREPDLEELDAGFDALLKHSDH